MLAHEMARSFRQAAGNNWGINPAEWLKGVFGSDWAVDTPKWFKGRNPRWDLPPTGIASQLLMKSIPPETEE